jgi:Holliday junction resolvase-like predicted endonuclease
LTKPSRELLPERKKGLRAELLAAAWLVEQGFWVFTPLGQHGPIDLIAVSKTGRVHLFDVKSVTHRAGAYYPGAAKLSGQTEFQQNAGVRIIGVDLKTGEVFLTTKRRINEDRRVFARSYTLDNK